MDIENPFTGIDGRPCTNCDAIVDGDRGVLVDGDTDLGTRLNLAPDEYGALCGECAADLEPDPLVA